jgi:hypothetical protein
MCKFGRIFLQLECLNIYVCSVSTNLALCLFTFHTLCTLPLVVNFGLFVGLLWWECMLSLPFDFSMGAPPLQAHLPVFHSLFLYVARSLPFLLFNNLSDLSTVRYSSPYSVVQKPFTYFLHVLPHR